MLCKLTNTCHPTLPAAADVRLLALGRDDFTSLLGPLQELLESQAVAYDTPTSKISKVAPDAPISVVCICWGWGWKVEAQRTRGRGCVSLAGTLPSCCGQAHSPDISLLCSYRH